MHVHDFDLQPVELVSSPVSEKTRQKRTDTLYRHEHSIYACICEKLYYRRPSSIQRYILLFSSLSYSTSQVFMGMTLSTLQAPVQEDLAVPHPVKKGTTLQAKAQHRHK